MLRSIRRPLVSLLLLVLLALAPASAVSQAAGAYYTVKSGDTISGIAKRHGLSSSQLASANRLRSDARLLPGTKLWVPKSSTSGGNAGARKPSSSVPLKTPTPQQLKGPSGSSSSAGKQAVSPRQTATSAPQGAVHIVKPGETLWRIADANGTTAAKLAQANGLDMNKPLQVGQKIQISGRSSGTSAVAAPASKKAKAAPLPDVEDVPGGGVVAVARREPVVAEPSAAQNSPAASVQPSSRGYIWPVEGRLLRRFTNRAEEKYTGIDIAAPKGTEIRAANQGKVVYADDSIPFYGRMIIVQHSGGVATCYGQLDRILVTEGQQVRRGQVIGRSGDSGKGSGPHLHFEVRLNGEAVNPEPYLP